MDFVSEIINTVSSINNIPQTKFINVGISGDNSVIMTNTVVNDNMNQARFLLQRSFLTWSISSEVRPKFVLQLICIVKHKINSEYSL